MRDIKPTKDSFVMQSNLIGRSIYNMPASSRRLLACAMAHIRGVDDMDVTMRIADIVDALGLNDDGGAVRARIKGTVTKLQKELLFIENENGWEQFAWIGYAKYDAKKDSLRLRFQPELAPYLKDFKEAYSCLPVWNFGQLEGKYSLRFYELVMTNNGLNGKNGCAKGTWECRYDIAYLRKIFNIAETEYQRQNNFRVRVIDEPIEEINNSGIGLFIKPEYIKKRKELVSIVLVVSVTKKSELKNITPVTETQDEDLLFIERNKDSFEDYLKTGEAQKSMFGGGNATSMEAHNYAIKQMKKDGYK